MALRPLAAVLFIPFAFAAPVVAAAPEAKDSPADIFGTTKIWEFHLALTAKDYDAMQPPTGGFFGGPGGPGGPGFPGRPPAPPKVADKPTDVHKGGSFGIEFPVVHADFSAEGKTTQNVGLRYKGGGSYVMSATRLKRNFKVELDHYDPDVRFRGHKKLNLNAGAMDATGMREALAFAVYREAGVPAPRTAFAEVFLTVPGKWDKELLGTYTLIEQVDKFFLKDRFKNSKGLLMKPEVRFGPNMGRGPLGFQGDDWEPYKATLQPKRDATKDEQKRVIDFARLINRADDEQFRKEIGSYLDVDEAVTALIVNMDSFFVGGHNAYVYLNPETNKFVFIPWDLDLSFGGFFPFGSADQQADVSLTHPYPGEHRLVDRVLAVKELNEQYQKVLKDVAARAFTKDKLLANLDAIEKTTKEPRARETKAVAARRENTNFGFGPPGMGGQGTNLRTFIDKRTASVTAQVEGKSKGTIPAGFGFGPGPMAPPRLGDILPAPIQNALRLTEEQKRQFAELQKEVDARVEKLLTEEQRRQLKEMRERGPGGPGGPPKRPLGPPG
jgi:spore coat protein H